MKVHLIQFSLGFMATDQTLWWICGAGQLGCVELGLRGSGLAILAAIYAIDYQLRLNQNYKFLFLLNYLLDT